jgi:hypothetical protein
MLRHRHKLVRFRTSVMNQLHALAMGQGLCRRKKLWAKVGRKELEGLVLDPWARLRREELLQLLDQLDPWIDKLVPYRAPNENSALVAVTFSRLLSSRQHRRGRPARESPRYIVGRGR